MMKRILSVIAASLFVAACSSQQQSTSGTTATEQPTSMGQAMGTTAPNGPPGSITIKIAALNGSGESGTATLTPMGDRTRVVIGITGENATGKQPAHIHKGRCPSVNPAPWFPLKDVVLGKSNTVVDAPLSAILKTASAINIHESAKNLTKYVACGDIMK